MSERLRKIESQIREIVGEEVDSLSDPRVYGLVTITGVRVSPDLAHATVYYSVLGEAPEEAGEGLQSAAGRIQSALGTQTRLKKTPRLHFEADPVVERASRVEAALRDVREERESDD